MRDHNHPAFVEQTYGTQGIGKTTAFLRRLRKQRAQLIAVYDHKQQFAGLLEKKPISTAEDLWDGLNRGGYVVFDPSEMFPGKKEEGLIFFCDLIYNFRDAQAKEMGDRIIKSRTIIVIDELQRLTDVYNEPSELKLCCDDGRSLKIDVMTIAQNANAIHNSIRNQATEIFVFRQADDNALDFLVKGAGFNADEIRALKPGEWLWRNLNTGQAARGGEAFEISNKGLPDGAIQTNAEEATASGKKV